jgi:hypothetical protein
MDTRTRTLILAAMLAALAASLFLLFTGGEILQRFPGNAQPTDFIKPTTGILGSMRGTATAEAEKATPESATPEPQADDASQPGTKTEPRQSLWDWWEEQRLPDNWTSA